MKTTLRNGRSAGMSPSQFNQQELAWGTRVEMEHTSSKKTAQRIAMDHLVEDPRYYQKLAEVHLDSVDSGVSSGASRKKRKLESVLKRYLRDNADWIRRRFGEPGKFLGCGAWGCAWKMLANLAKGRKKRAANLKRRH